MNQTPQRPVQVFVPASKKVNLTDKSLKTLLVKFFFNNRTSIPVGIPEKDRIADVSLDQANAKSATDKGNSKLAQIGRIRQGRVDTGRPVLQNLDYVQVRVLRTSLCNAGVCLVNAHWYYHVGKDKYIVVLEYAMPGHSQAYTDKVWPEVTLNGIRALSRVVWQYCHVWENRSETTGADGVVTVNLVGMQQTTQRAKHMLAVRDYHLVALPFLDAED